MGRRQPPVAVPEDARDLVATITTRGAQFWDTLRNLNRGDRDGTRRTTGADIDALLAESGARDELIDELRRRYFPRTARLTVDQWGVYTWSPTGRVVRMVWTIPQTALHCDADTHV